MSLWVEKMRNRSTYWLSETFWGHYNDSTSWILMLSPSGHHHPTSVEAISGCGPPVSITPHMITSSLIFLDSPCRSKLVKQKITSCPSLEVKSSLHNRLSNNVGHRNQPAAEFQTVFRLCYSLGKQGLKLSLPVPWQVIIRINNYWCVSSTLKLRTARQN